MKMLACPACLVLVTWCSVVRAEPLVESARDLPLAYDVDVAVVGGTTGGVAAAAAAAEAGASVFLAAPRPYLGEDLCATYRLWLEPGEVPTSALGKAVFADPRLTRGLSYTYTADQPSMDQHIDTDPPSMLADGQWDNAFRQSVQYNADTSVICDFGEDRSLDAVRFMLFQSPGRFEIAEMAVAVSLDGETWQPVATVPNPRAGKVSFVETHFEVAMPLETRTRYVRCRFRKPDRAERMLIGEILFVADPSEWEDDRGLLAATPMQIKRSLDDALLEAGVPFLYACCPAEALRDADGRLAGLTVTNRAGRQAVRAKVVIDATDRASFARLAGARFRPYPAGPQRFRRVVVGGEPVRGQGVTSRRVPLRIPFGGKSPAAYGTGNWARKRNLLMERVHESLIEYTLTIGMPDGTFGSFAAAEQLGRDMTFHTAMLDESETLFQVPPDPVIAVASLTGAWPGAERADLRWFRPGQTPHLYILGGCADVPRPVAETLLRPIEYMALGRRLGAEAAREAAARPALSGVNLPGDGRPGFTVDCREALAGLRPGRPVTATIPAGNREIPVWATVDVLVVGGGTSGAPAAVGAATMGADTLVVEALHGLGGVATTGQIGIYCAGYREGYTKRMETAITELGADSYVIGKMEHWRRQIREAGGGIWFGALGVGACVEGNRVIGAVVATPHGRGVILADVVIDGTGNADIAAAAGAACQYIGADHVAMQGAGLPNRELGARYLNTDWTFVDETDMIDVWSAYVAAKRRYPNAFDLGQLIDTRERRRIVGDHVLTPIDIVTRRRFPDTIAIANGGVLDTHGYTVHPYYMVNEHRGGISYTPYRCLLPKGLDGILVVGLGVSAHRDAIPSIRMQPYMQNLGYAAGVCAARIAAQGIGTRDLDLAPVQQHLAAVGCITESEIEAEDSFPPDEAVRQGAVRTLAQQDYSQLSLIFAAGEAALPALRDACRDAGTPPGGRLRCAHVLALIGDPSGVPVLVEAVEALGAWDEERIGSKYHPSITWQDSYITALGVAGDRRAVPAILARAKLVGTGGAANRFSHYRAVAVALERLGDPRAIPVITALLRNSRGSTAVVKTAGDKDFVRRTRGGQTGLILARALFRLGDSEDGLGKQVLQAYEQDLRGLYARHARAVLSRGPAPRP